MPSHVRQSETRILVYRPGFFGDSVLALPALWEIRRRYPHAELFLLTNSPSHGQVGVWDVVEPTGIFFGVLFYNPDAKGGARAREWVALITRIRRLRPAILYYLAPTPRTAAQVRRDSIFLRWFCGVPLTQGMHATDDWVGRTDECGPVPLPHESARLLRIVGEGIHARQFPIPITDPDRRLIDLVWQRASIPPDAITVAFCPGAKTSVARWPREKFRGLAQALLAAFPRLILLILGGGADAPASADLDDGAGGRVVNLAGQLSVWQSAEAMRRCSLFVGNDSGPMHLAALMGVPCVAVFSARAHPGMWDPLVSERVIIRKNVTCAGCLRSECPDHDSACIRGIEVDEVFAACRALLSKTSPWEP